MSFTPLKSKPGSRHLQRLRRRSEALLKASAQGVLDHFGLSIHRKAGIERLRWELERLDGAPSAASSGPPATLQALGDVTAGDRRLRAEYEKSRAALAWYEVRKHSFDTTEDYDALEKYKGLVDSVGDFGACDFSDLTPWLFASSPSNHRILHQRIDEGSSLWRAVKATAGPIVEVGRAAGGSTVTILGASGDRPVVSIDRDPQSCTITEYVFVRPEVRRRLTLYTQSSREPIRETEFGMMFIDGDHSYEGVCHDIATFWNSLKPLDGKPAFAVFHDAAENPITFVEPVKRACDELIGERGVARVVESWGAMLVVEKLGDIDQNRWYAKEDKAFWRWIDKSGNSARPPQTISMRLHPDRPQPKKGTINYLGGDNLDQGAWIKTGVVLERPYREADNPVRLVRDTAETGAHGIERTAKLGVARFGLTAFVRPINATSLRLSILGADRTPLGNVDFELGQKGRIIGPHTGSGVEIVDAAFLYGNGFFRCELSLAAPQPVAQATVAVNCLSESGEFSYRGSGGRGFFMNLASLRELN